jgi:hypothetical protein
LVDGYGRCEQQLICFYLFLFGEKAHSKERNHQKEDDADIVEKGREDHLVDIHLLEVIRVSSHLHGLSVEPPDEAVEKETDKHKKHGDGHIGNRGCEVCLYLFFAYSPYVSHCSVPPVMTLR